MTRTPECNESYVGAYRIRIVTGGGVMLPSRRPFGERPACLLYASTAAEARTGLPSARGNGSCSCGRPLLTDCGGSGGSSDLPGASWPSRRVDGFRGTCLPFAVGPRAGFEQILAGPESRTRPRGYRIIRSVSRWLSRSTDLFHARSAGTCAGPLMSCGHTPWPLALSRSPLASPSRQTRR
jgi:hypothetical protein